MTMTDPVADMLTRVRNASLAHHDSTEMPSSKIKVNLAKVLEQEGYIEGYSVEPTEPQPTLTVRLKYGPNRERVITGLRHLEARPARVREADRDPARARRARRRHPVDQRGARDRPCGAQPRTRRRDRRLRLVS